MRVSADDAERLGLLPGQQVSLRLPGEEAGTLLLTSAQDAPPFVCLRLSRLRRTRAQPLHGCDLLNPIPVSIDATGKP